MLALKKKREAEKKAKEEAAKNAEGGAADPAAAPAAGGQVSLFGIGGQKKTKKGETTGTKKSPGEIRIQKGRNARSVSLAYHSARSEMVSHQTCRYR